MDTCNTEIGTRNKVSYLSGNNNQPYIYTSVIEAFKKKVGEHPDKEALIYRDIHGSRFSMTFKELEIKATKLARFLISHGIRKGDRVAIVGINTLEWVVAEFAIFMTGAIVVSATMKEIKQSNITKYINACKCRAMFVDVRGREMYLDAIKQLITEFQDYIRGNDKENNGEGSVILLSKYSGLHYSDVVSILELDDLPDIAFPDLYPEDPIKMLSSSGTTGDPKAVEFTHFIIVNQALMKHQSSYKIFNDKSFGWAGGKPERYILRGQTRVFTDGALTYSGHNTKEIWNMIKSEKCHVAVVTPYMLSELICMKDRYKESFKLTQISVSGQIVDNYYMQAVGVFCDRMTIDYGMTETGSISFTRWLTKGDSFESGDVGFIQADKEIKIMDKSESITDLGTPGEICVRGGYMCARILTADGEFRSLLTPDRWFKTGDRGLITPSGKLIIHGRVNEEIMFGINYIFPNEIESVILNIDGVKMVVAVSVPYKHGFEDICVCYVPEVGNGIHPDEVDRIFREKYLRDRMINYPPKLPKYFLPFGEFPLLLSGKPNKREIKEKAIGILQMKRISE